MSGALTKGANYSIDFQCGAVMGRSYIFKARGNVSACRAAVVQAGARSGASNGNSDISRAQAGRTIGTLVHGFHVCKRVYNLCTLRCCIRLPSSILLSVNLPSSPPPVLFHPNDARWPLDVRARVYLLICADLPHMHCGKPATTFLLYLLSLRFFPFNIFLPHFFSFFFFSPTYLFGDRLKIVGRQKNKL